MSLRPEPLAGAAAADRVVLARHGGRHDLHLHRADPHEPRRQRPPERPVRRVVSDLHRRRRRARAARRRRAAAARTCRARRPSSASRTRCSASSRSSLILGVAAALATARGRPVHHPRRRRAANSRAPPSVLQIQGLALIASFAARRLELRAALAQALPRPAARQPRWPSSSAARSRSRSPAQRRRHRRRVATLCRRERARARLAGGADATVTPSCVRIVGIARQGRRSAAAPGGGDRAALGPASLSRRARACSPTGSDRAHARRAGRDARAAARRLRRNGGSAVDSRRRARACGIVPAPWPRPPRSR